MGQSDSTDAEKDLGLMVDPKKINMSQQYDATARNKTTKKGPK